MIHQWFNDSNSSWISWTVLTKVRKYSITFNGQSEVISYANKISSYKVTWIWMPWNMTVGLDLYIKMSTIMDIWKYKPTMQYGKLKRIWMVRRQAPRLWTYKLLSFIQSAIYKTLQDYFNIYREDCVQQDYVPIQAVFTLVIIFRRWNLWFFESRISNIDITSCPRFAMFKYLLRRGEKNRGHKGSVL